MPVTGRLVDESVRQRMKSICQRRMSVRQRRWTTEYRVTFALTRISIIPRSFIHCEAKQTAKYVYPELNARQLFPRSFIHAPYNLSLIPPPSQTKKYIGHWVPKWLAYKRWGTDIRRWRIDLMRWRTRRLRSDSSAKHKRLKILTMAITKQLQNLVFLSNKNQLQSFYWAIFF